MINSINIDIASTKRDEEDYNNFIESHPGATLYQTTKFRDFIIHCIGGDPVYLIARCDDKVTGVMPFMVQEGELGKIVNSLPFFGSYGDILSSHTETRSALSLYFNEFLQNKKISSATIIGNPFCEKISEFIRDKDLVDTRIVQWTELRDEQSIKTNILSQIDGSARRNLKKCEKEGIQVKIDNTALGFLEENHRKNMAEIGGLQKPPTFFSAIDKLLIPDSDYKLYVAHKSGKYLAALLVFYFKNYAEYIMPVTLEGYRELQPTSIIIYEAMIDAANSGMNVWNWGGTWTTQAGVYRFKKKWAAKERIYNYYTKLYDKSILGYTEEQLFHFYPYWYVVPHKYLLKNCDVQA